jgi:hypothetical protein
LVKIGKEPRGAFIQFQESVTEFLDWPPQAVKVFITSRKETGDASGIRI